VAIRFVLCALGLNATLFLSACHSTTEEGMVSREEYVEVYVELLRAADAAPDSFAASDSARRILAAHGLTEEDLLDYVRSHADDPDHLAEAWRKIEEQLRAPEPEDTAAGGDTARVLPQQR
jgi:hypothetical protein